jgi:hypothetical protein
MNRLQVALQQVEAAIVAIAGRAGPLLAPVPTAYLVYAATLEFLAWPQTVAFVAALVIECLGLASTGLVLELYNYNKNKLSSEPDAPVALAVVLVSAYFVVATGLTVVLDLYTGMARYAPAIFPALSLAGVSILAMRADHRQRVSANNEARESRASKRLSRRMSKQVPKPRREIVQAPSSIAQAVVHASTENAQNGVQNAHLDDANVQRQVSKQGVLDKMVNVYLDNPGMGATAMAKALGVSRSSVYNYNGELALAGRIKKNGKGYEAVESSE